MDSYRRLLTLARDETKRIAHGLTEADLSRQVVRHPPDGSTRTYNVDWSFYHLVEHLAGHHAQILLLQHLHAHHVSA